jgi:hypothetical protein
MEMDAHMRENALVHVTKLQQKLQVCFLSFIFQELRVVFCVDFLLDGVRLASSHVGKRNNRR